MTWWWWSSWSSLISLKICHVAFSHLANNIFVFFTFSMKISSYIFSNLRAVLLMPSLVSSLDPNLIFLMATMQSESSPSLSTMCRSLALYTVANWPLNQIRFWKQCWRSNWLELLTFSEEWDLFVLSGPLLLFLLIEHDDLEFDLCLLNWFFN